MYVFTGKIYKFFPIGQYQIECEGPPRVLYITWLQKKIILEIEWDMLISFKMKRTIHDFFIPSRPYGTIIVLVSP